MSRIHPTALVDPGAELGEGVRIGPFAIVGPAVQLGDEVEVGPRASVVRNTRLAAGVRVGEGSVIGGDPQDLKFAGEESWVEIGQGTVIREYSTVNRGTAASGVTRVGDGCFLMSYVHVAHDCHLGHGVIIANGTQLAGHVTLEDRVTVSGLCAIHQFVSVGTFAFLGGCSRVSQDIPPYVKAVGNPTELFGLNAIGLQRAGMPAEAITALKRAYRLFFNSDLNLGQARERAGDELPDLPEVRRFVEFLGRSRRGVPA
ncbi:MAG: acyl-ACP--UDP-N-acetylglucosamine O-acyltransferase [Gemmatimonadales bacterium]